MRTFTNILIILTSFVFGCNRYDDFDCNQLTQSRDIRLPFVVLDSVIIFITFDNFHYQNKLVLPMNNLLYFNYINDSIFIKKTNLIGTPLKMFKNKNGKVVLITSKCIYSINKDYKMILENQFNFNSNNNKFKTLYDWVDDNLIIMPGIDNQDRNIYNINTNEFSFDIFNNNHLEMFKFDIVDFIFPKSLNNIDFIFTNGSKYFIVKDNNKIEKSLPDNNKILSLSYNYFDNEICIGTNNGSVYYDDFTEIRKNVLKNGFKFPVLFCNEAKITTINFENNLFQIFQNNNLFSTYHYNYFENREGAKGISKYYNIEEMIVPINNKKNEEDGYSVLTLYNNELFFNFSGNSMLKNGIDGKIIPNLMINYNKKTLEIDRRGGNVKTKRIYYEE